MLDPHAELLRINARIKEILLQHMPRTGTYHSPVPGLVTRRLETCHTTTTCLGKPSASIIVQGEKIVMLGDREIHYTGRSITGRASAWSRASTCPTPSASSRPAMTTPSWSCRCSWTGA